MIFYDVISSFDPKPIASRDSETGPQYPHGLTGGAWEVTLNSLR